MNGFVWIGFAGVTLVVAACAIARSAAEPKDGVGSRPGEVVKRLDSDAAARRRGRELAMFGAGWFWGVEAEFRRIPGVAATAVGYSGGAAQDPTYEQVCGGKTGHAEVVLIEFDPKKVSYDRLLDVFFKNHNPALACHPGAQYRSAAFFYGDAQRKAAEAAKAILKKRGIDAKTEVTKASTFWMAEGYHQQYYGK